MGFAFNIITLVKVWHHHDHVPHLFFSCSLLPLPSSRSVYNLIKNNYIIILHYTISHNRATAADPLHYFGIPLHHRFCVPKLPTYHAHARTCTSPFSCHCVAVMPSSSVRSVRMRGSFRDVEVKLPDLHFQDFRHLGSKLRVRLCGRRAHLATSAHLSPC